MQTQKITMQSINENIKKDLNNYILKAEQNYKDQIEKVVEYVTKNKDIKFVFLAGPSGSGKTTTSHIFSQKLSQIGVKTHPISLDDFFVNRDETPFWEDGLPNYETSDAIDWALFEKCMKELMSGKSVKLPTYNFTTGLKEFDKETTLDTNTIFIVEGLHALNPIIARYLPENVFCNVFISTNTDIFNGKKMVIEHHKVRLFRRLIRDLYTRSTSLSENILMWKKVRLGEKLYISPFKDNAMFNINSFHPYEMCVYKKIFCSLKQDDKTLQELCAELNDFDELDSSVVPTDSVLQEFMPKNKSTKSVK